MSETFFDRATTWLRWQRYRGHEWTRRYFITHHQPEDYFRWRWPWPLRKPYERAKLRLYSIGGGLGDELMCTPVLREIRRRNPYGHLTFISRHPELFRGHAALDAVEPYAKSALAGAVSLTYGPPVPPPRPLITLLGECVGFSFFDNQLDAPQVEPSAEIQRRLTQIAPPRVVIQPQASRWTPNKVWPAEQWRELVRQLVRDYQVIELGTEPMFASGEFGAGFHSWAGTTSLADFVWTVSQAAVFVGPPSGGMHLANAFHIPSVILYGGYETPAGHQYPRVQAFYSEVPCAPCWLQENCPYDLKCLRMIAPDEVAAAVRVALALPAAPAP